MDKRKFEHRSYALLPVSVHREDETCVALAFGGKKMGEHIIGFKPQILDLLLPVDPPDHGPHGDLGKLRKMVHERFQHCQRWVRHSNQGSRAEASWMACCDEIDIILTRIDVAIAVQKSESQR